MRQIFKYGWMGVELFFVISGFVIPYSLLKTNFKISYFKQFLLKRIMRIEPAYIASILITILLAYFSTLSSAYAGLPFELSFTRIVLHLGYLVDLFEQEWLNPVYWTLAIEFQYYLLIGILISYWNNTTKNMILLTLACFLALSLLRLEVLTVLKYTDIFTIGILGALNQKGFINKTWFLVIAIFVSVIICYNHDWIVALLSLSTALIIVFAGHSLNFKPLLFLGLISYSLYLIHVPIGGRIINIAKRLDLSEIQKIFAILAAIIISVIASWLFYLLVEKPSHLWSRKLSLQKTKTNLTD